MIITVLTAFGTVFSSFSFEPSSLSSLTDRLSSGISDVPDPSVSPSVSCGFGSEPVKLSGLSGLSEIGADVTSSTEVPAVECVSADTCSGTDTVVTVSASDTEASFGVSCSGGGTLTSAAVL